jgi:hypothetical protein
MTNLILKIKNGPIELFFNLRMISNKHVNSWEEDIINFQNRWPFNADYQTTKFQVDKKKKRALYQFNKEITILFQFNDFYPKNPPKIYISHIKGSMENFIQILTKKSKHFVGIM